MKTQLLEDFDESGSAPSRAVPPPAARPATQAAAPADTPAAPPRPAVWQRPRQAEVAAPAPAPAAPTPAPARVQAPVHPRGFAPQPTASGATVPLGDTTTPAWPQGTSSGGDPDWLTERLARDAALQERTEWNGLWKRRLASWGAAGVLLALLAGGGLWLYEQSRVEGALVVVANTNPAPDAHTLQPVSAPAAAAAATPAVTLPAPAQAAPARSGADAIGGTAGPMTESGPVPDTSPATDTNPAPVTSPATAAGTAEPQAPVFADRTVVPVAADAAPAPKPKRKHPRVSRRSEPEARAEVRDSERSYRQRYEETLMQCRAHGYDERQCLQRGCEMTKYGFACKG